MNQTAVCAARMAGSCIVSMRYAGEEGAYPVREECERMCRHLPAKIQSFSNIHTKIAF